MGTLLRYPYEVRSEDEYFDEIQDVKVTKDMLDLAIAALCSHLVECGLSGKMRAITYGLVRIYG
jgi:hypothetical protein